MRTETRWEQLDARMAKRISRLIGIPKILGVGESR